MTDRPAFQPRPKLDRWLRDRGLGASALGERWGITPQGASRYLLPFANPKRLTPTTEKVADIFAWTGGEVTAADWYPAELSGAPLHASVGDLSGAAQ